MIKRHWEFIRWRALPIMVSVAAIVISAVLTVQLAIRLGAGGAVWLAIAIGLVWDVSKYLFTSAGWHMVRSHFFHDRMMGAALLSIGAVLIIGSVGSSLAHMSEADTTLAAVRQAEERKVRTELTRVQGEIAAVEASIKEMRRVGRTIAQAQERDVEYGYRARAASWSEQADRIITESNGMLLRLSDLRKEEGRLNDAVIASARQRYTGMSGRMPFYLVIAVVLELVSVLAPITLYRPAGGGETVGGPEARSTVPSRRKKPPKAFRLIADGKLRPTYMALRKELGVTQEKAGEILKSCEEEGILVKKEGGRGWTLATEA